MKFKFGDVATPVMTWQGTILGPMGLASDEGIAPGQTTISIVGPQHPIASGLSGSKEIKSPAGGFNWGVPGPGAVTIATLSGDASKSTLFTYEIGATMVGRPAPSRRVVFSASPELTSIGWQLFEASVQWVTEVDTDRDGLIDLEELSLGSNPNDGDSNDDGLSDAMASAIGQDPTNTDLDGDGLSNAAEIQKGTDPYRPDTDGDGTFDAADAFPLDPTRSQAPAPTPGDVTPPIITLLEPTNVGPPQ